jgi:ribonucleoside-triphosphate reductase
MDSVSSVRKRDGRVVPFDSYKIFTAIRKALVATDSDRSLAERLGRQAIALCESKTFLPGNQQVPEVEDFQDSIEEILMRNGLVKTAKAFILYREQRAQSRQTNALAGATIDMFSRYLDDSDWVTKENANQQRSVNGLNNYVRESFTRHYWLHEVYPQSVRKSHEEGHGHLHDLGFLGPYCAGWDLRQLLTKGFGGVPGKVESRPAKHLRSFLGQVVNSTFTTQGECAGAQAWSSFDTYCAPFVRADKMNYKQVRQCLQEFIFNLNVPTRVGFSCPFSNLTFDLKVPKTLKDQAVIIGGELQESSYGEYQKEMDLFNRAFCDAMMEGDAKGRVFTFPIPTINVSKDFDWEHSSTLAFLETSAKYGIPYFANYVNSDLSPEDAVSMCCRLRLDATELRKRGGGLFGSNPLTGSIGVYTINLSRIGYLAQNESDFKLRLLEQMEVARDALEIKRKVIEQHTHNGLYPYCAGFLKEVYERTGHYWHNHFSTIGIVGMHEAMMNFTGKGLENFENHELAVRMMHFMRDTLKVFQEETGHVYNLEATPAEGASHRLARLDRQQFKDIYISGKEVPYYTNSTQLPVDYTDDLFELLDHQEVLQSLYTGGTVQHLYLGEAVEDVESLKVLLKNLFHQYKMPYISFTPTFSVCPDHGNLRGNQPECPHCSNVTEVWSRVTGYLRPVSNFNAGKKEEFTQRKMFKLPEQELLAATV